LRVGQAGAVVPDVGGFLEAVGDSVGIGDAGVAVDFKLGMIVGFQERDDKKRFGLGAEIGGDVADADTARGGAVVVVGLDGGL